MNATIVIAIVTKDVDVARTSLSKSSVFEINKIFTRKNSGIKFKPYTILDMAILESRGDPAGSPGRQIVDLLRAKGARTYMELVHIPPLPAAVSGKPPLPAAVSKKGVTANGIRSQAAAASAVAASAAVAATATKPKVPVAPLPSQQVEPFRVGSTVITSISVGKPVNQTRKGPNQTRSGTVTTHPPINTPSTKISGITVKKGLGGKRRRRVRK